MAHSSEGALGITWHLALCLQPSPPAVVADDPAALQAVVTAREIVKNHASEVQECFRIAQGYGPVTVSKTRTFEAIFLETISLPSPPTDDPVPVYALIKCIRERAQNWGLPTRHEHSGFDVFFFLGPSVRLVRWETRG